MKNIFLYVPDAMSDHEIGYLLQALSMQNLLKAPKYQLKIFGATTRPIRTLGGMTIVPDCCMEDIDEITTAALILPGAESWGDAEQIPVLDLTEAYLKWGILVGAIGGSTLAMANRGLLNNCKHTGNSLEGLLDYTEKYFGKPNFRSDLAVVDKNLVTASSTGGLQWAKLILEYLKVFPQATIDAWYNYFFTGDYDYFAQMLSTFNKKQ